MNRVPSLQDVQSAISSGMQRVPSLHAIFGDHIVRDDDHGDDDVDDDDGIRTSAKRNSNSGDDENDNGDDDTTSERVDVFPEPRASKIDEIVSHSLANSTTNFSTSRNDSTAATTTTADIPANGEFVMTDDNVKIFFRRSG